MPWQECLILALFIAFRSDAAICLGLIHKGCNQRLLVWLLLICIIYSATIVFHRITWPAHGISQMGWVRFHMGWVRIKVPTAIYPLSRARQRESGAQHHDPPPLNLSSFFILTDPCFCPHLQTTSLPFPQWPWEVRVAGSSHCCSLQEHIGVTGAQFYVAVLSSSGNQEHRRWSTCKWACGGLVYRKVADEGWGSIVVGLTRSLTSGYAGAEPVAVAGPWYTFKSLCWWTTLGLSSDGPVRQTWSARDLIPILLGLPLSVKQQH